jgi:hypothetical protein
MFLITRALPASSGPPIRADILSTSHAPPTALSHHAAAERTLSPGDRVSGRCAHLPLEPNIMKRLCTTLARSHCPDQSAATPRQLPLTHTEPIGRWRVLEGLAYRGHPRTSSVLSLRIHRPGGRCRPPRQPGPLAPSAGQSRHLPEQSRARGAPPRSQGMAHRASGSAPSDPFQDAPNGAAGLDHCKGFRETRRATLLQERVRGGL